jgi:GAF domain-containing protein
MSDPSREAILAETFVALADTLVAGYDMVDLLQTLVERTVEVVDAEAAGIILAGESGQLEVVASTDESSHLIDLMQLQGGEGPCIEAYLSGRIVAVEQFADDGPWPAFAARARALGFASSHSVPMRLRADTIGALNLFRVRPGRLSADDAEAARALTDVATIGILQERAFRESDIARRQLQRALDSRVVIEQAKGFVAHTRSIGLDDAFRLIRGHARSSSLPLQDVARAILDGSLEL